MSEGPRNKPPGGPCKKPLKVGQWKTWCVLDKGHGGPCESYADVLRLKFVTTVEAPK